MDADDGDHHSDRQKRATNRNAGSSPDSTGQKGRPYPYMIFRNMETLGIVRKVLKVGDTASDIKKGKHAGVWSAGVIVGSSEMGLTESTALSPEEKRGEM